MNKGFFGFCFSILLLTSALSINIYSQDGLATPLPAPKAAATPLASAVLENALAKLGDGVTREQREKAYAKLLEGQRFLETAKRSLTQNEYQANVRLSKTSFQNAVELDPSLSEAYTAIAELSTIDEAVKIAVLALKVNPDSYAAHRMLGRVYTLKARLTEVNFDKSFVEKAIIEWKEVARLDPRGSEPWAYLSELYNRTNRSAEELDALNKWIGSVAPASRFEYDFYRRATGGQELAPEGASLRLARALLKANREREALEVISRKIADEPESEEAVELLKQALEKTGKDSTAQVVQSLQQAVYANPSNVSLVEVLAGIQARAGMPDEAIKTLRTGIAKTDKSEKLSIAKLYLTLGDTYADAGNDKEAVAAYEAALKTQDVGDTVLTDESDRFFATQVLSSIIDLHKNAQRFEEAKAVIERSRLILGKDDPFADLQLLKLLRDSGKKAEALRTVRALRQKTPTSDEYFYQEAYILTDLGRVEEAVAMIRTKIVNKGKLITSPPAVTRDINNYLTISGLYSQAKQGQKAVDAAQIALALAQSEDLKEVVLLTLATAQNEAGDFRSSEKTLRDILEKTPDNTTALNNLGYFLTERGEKLDEALQMIQKAVKAQPENSSFLDSLGWAYFKLGNYEEAEKTLKDANRRDASSATILDHLGDVYAKQGKLELARVTWQKALNLTSDNTEVGKIKAKLGKKPGR
jgi:tetratricopeptide (TPR) repeat protein